MPRYPILTVLAHGLLVTTAVAPSGLSTWEPWEQETFAVRQISTSGPDMLFINGRAYALE